MEIRKRKKTQKRQALLRVGKERLLIQKMTAPELGKHNECFKHFQIYEILYFATTAVF